MEIVVNNKRMSLTKGEEWVVNTLFQECRGEGTLKINGKSILEDSSLERYLLLKAKQRGIKLA